MAQSIPAPTRPQMRNYGIISDDAGLLSWDWVSSRMEKSRNYWIGSTRADGRPHAAPVWGIWHDTALYFGADQGSLKARNLMARPDVVVHLESGDEVVIVEGVAVSLPEGSGDLHAIYEKYLQKYGIDLEKEPMPGALMIAVRPRLVLAWLETDFPNTATRWVFS